MRQKQFRLTDEAHRVVKDIKRQIWRRYSAEEKIRIVLAGLRGKSSIAELCRQEGIAQRGVRTPGLVSNLQREIIHLKHG